MNINGTIGTVGKMSKNVFEGAFKTGFSISKVVKVSKKKGRKKRRR